MLVVIGLLVGAVAAVIAYILIHTAPRYPVTARRLTAPAIAALLVLSPALTAAAKAGPGPVLQTLALAAVLATIFGYPMVRLFEPKPRDGD